MRDILELLLITITMGCHDIICSVITKLSYPGLPHLGAPSTFTGGALFLGAQFKEPSSPSVFSLVMWAV